MDMTASLEDTNIDGRDALIAALAAALQDLITEILRQGTCADVHLTCEKLRAASIVMARARVHADENG